MWQKFHKAIDPMCQTGTLQTSKDAVTVWGEFTKASPSSLIVLNLSLTTGVWYVNILCDHWHLLIRTFFLHDDIVFQNDTTPSPATIISIKLCKSLVKKESPVNMKHLHSLLYYQLWILLRLSGICWSASFLDPILWPSSAHFCHR